MVTAISIGRASFIPVNRKTGEEPLQRAMVPDRWPREAWCNTIKEESLARLQVLACETRWPTPCLIRRLDRCQPSAQPLVKWQIIRWAEDRESPTNKGRVWQKYFKWVVWSIRFRTLQMQPGDRLRRLRNVSAGKSSPLYSIKRRSTNGSRCIPILLATTTINKMDLLKLTMSIRLMAFKLFPDLIPASWSQLIRKGWAQIVAQTRVSPPQSLHPILETILGQVLPPRWSIFRPEIRASKNSSKVSGTNDGNSNADSRHYKQHNQRKRVLLSARYSIWVTRVIKLGRASAVSYPIPRKSTQQIWRATHKSNITVEENRSLTTLPEI